MRYLALLVFLLPLSLFAETYTDTRPGADNQEYSYREVGNLLWIERNMSFNVENSLCYNNAADCTRMGRLYTWDQAQFACDTVEGWRVANDADWKDLENAFGMTDPLDQNAEGWHRPRGTSMAGRELMDDVDFGMGTPAGYYSRNSGFDGGPDLADKRTYFWSVGSDPDGSTIYFRRNLVMRANHIFRFQNGVGTFAISVRCVKDAPVAN